jgi:hypothetical protein
MIYRLAVKRHRRPGPADPTCEVPIGRLSPDDYARRLVARTRASAADRAEHATIPLVFGWPQSRRPADRARLIVV